MDFRNKHTWFKPQFQPDCRMFLKYSDFSTWKVEIHTMIKSVLNVSCVLLRMLGILTGMGRLNTHMRKKGNKPNAVTEAWMEEEKFDSS